jgi:hypothetical protein
MAYIRQAASGVWRAEAQFQGTRKSKTFKTEVEAREWGDREETSIRKRHEFREAMMCKTIMAHVPMRVMQAVEKVPFTKEELLGRAFPADLRCGIYFLIEGDDIVYVGQSTDVFNRLSRHRRDGKEFDSFNIIPCPEESLDELESTYIDAFAPWLNHSLGNVRLIRARAKAKTA